MDNPFDMPAETLMEMLERDPVLPGEARARAQAQTQAPKGRAVYHRDIEQGSEQWHQLRCGILTASEMKLVITATLKVADNDKVRSHLYHLAAQRVTKYVDPHFESYDMERGKFDEEHARAKYAETYGEVEECGFITNDKFGFTIGYSPDGLVGADGLTEIKSRLQKLQMQTLVEFVAKDAIPPDYLIQCQTGLLIADDRKWLDFQSYCGGMKMATVRCYPDPVIQEAIGNAAVDAERRIAQILEIYQELVASDARLVDTERLIYL